MPPDAALKFMNSAHRLIVGVTGGKVGWQFGSMPALELTTVGRKSGQKRAVLLTSPLREGDAYVVVASRGGDDHHPAWFLNLRDNPDVEVSIKGGPKEAWTAHVATPEERARLWPQIAGKYANYRGYQEKTKREIPLVLLSPR